MIEVFHDLYWDLFITDRRTKPLAATQDLSEMESFLILNTLLRCIQNLETVSVDPSHFDDMKSNIFGSFVPFFS